MSGITDSIAAVNVSPATPADRHVWDRFVQAHPEATFCHLWQWGDVLRETFGHRPRYFVARGADGEVEGVLPLIEMRTGLRKQLISLPYLNYGGPIGPAPVRQALGVAARRLVVDGGAARVELRSRTAGPDNLPAAREKVTVVLPLPETVEDLWQKTFRSKLRSQVRRAQRETMEVRFGANEVDAFYQVFRRNMRDLGTPVLPRRFFQKLLEHFADHVVFAAVYFEDVPVAAGCGFIFNDEFEITWASSLREYNSKAPNMLLYATLMEEMIRRGVSSFNFGRCTPGAGTHRFKLQWGGDDEALHWSEWPENGAGGDEPSAAMQLASRAWQRLPLWVAGTVGPRLAARMPQF